MCKSMNMNYFTILKQYCCLKFKNHTDYALCSESLIRTPVGHVKIIIVAVEPKHYRVEI